MTESGYPRIVKRWRRGQPLADAVTIFGDHGRERETLPVPSVPRREVIDELVDYTLSHFAFEEELMEEAGYPFCAAHKRVHEVFTKRVSEYRMRFQAGEDVVDELKSMLSRWLFNHIRNDDKAYSEQVRQHLDRFSRQHQQGNWLTRTVQRLFA